MARRHQPKRLAILPELQRLTSQDARNAENHSQQNLRRPLLATAFSRKRVSFGLKIRRRRAAPALALAKSHVMDSRKARSLCRADNRLG